MEFIYLDSNATSQPAPEVVAAMRDALETHWANPSSVHRPGQAVRQKVELARESIARLIGCRDRELVFTSGGTESVNLAMLGSLAAQPGRRAMASVRTEHSAVRDVMKRLPERGGEPIWLPLDSNGVVDVDTLQLLLAQRAREIALVTLMWVNNETGVMQPVARVGEMCRAHGVRFHTDATQAVGKLAIDVAALPIDLLTFSAHKFHGPKGIGGLYVARGVKVEPQVIGGPQERERRGGTENVPGIIGMGAAAALARPWLDTHGPRRQARLRDRFEQAMLDRVEVASINGVGAERVWTTSNIAFNRLEAETILLLLSERGVCASAGAACSSGSLEPSPVLLAMGIAPELAHGSVRFSLSRFTTEAEIDRALEIIAASIARLRSRVTVA
jgi:cysteine desulfurase